VGIEWSHDPKSYASSSAATGRVSLTRQVKGDDPDQKGYPGPPGWWLGVGSKDPTPYNQPNVMEPQVKINQRIFFWNKPGEEKGIMRWLLVHGMYWNNEMVVGLMRWLLVHGMYWNNEMVVGLIRWLLVHGMYWTNEMVIGT